MKLSKQIEKIARKIKNASTWALPDDQHKIDILDKYLKDLKNNKTNVIILASLNNLETLAFSWNQIIRATINITIAKKPCKFVNKFKTIFFTS